MSKRRIIRTPALNPGDPLRIESHGRRTAERGLPRLSAEQVARISRTVRRIREVVVKVSGGGPDAASIGAHLKYISRRGSLPLELDNGETVAGTAVQQTVTADWNLDALPRVTRPGRKWNRSSEPVRVPARSRPKAVHNIVLSMPAAVPPEKVLAAARVFARENFALAHRYAMVLHTDTRHPHVHLVVKAEREDGAGRLNIYKATLREWREQFAQALRDQGIEANATPAALRGRSERRLKTPIEQARRRTDPNGGRGGSTFVRQKVEQVANALLRGDVTALQAGRKALERSRASLDAQWERTARALDGQGEATLANAVRQFAATMPAVRTDAERIASALRRSRPRMGRDVSSRPSESLNVEKGR